MTPQELKAKIVEMLNCDEIHELRAYEDPCDAGIVAMERGILKYDKVIHFILGELDKGTNE